MSALKCAHLTCRVVSTTCGFRIALLQKLKLKEKFEDFIIYYHIITRIV